MMLDNCDCAKNPAFMQTELQLILSAVRTLSELFEARKYCEEMGRYFMVNLCAYILANQDITGFENEIRTVDASFRGMVN